MKFQGASALTDSPYAKRHPLWKRWLTFLLLSSFMIGALVVVWPFDHFGKEHGVRQSSYLHNSEPRTKNLNLKEVNVTLDEPSDNRGRDFSEVSLMNKIKSKMSTDMTHFGASSNLTNKNLTIKTTVKEFYSSNKGILWQQSIARVSLDMTATLNDSTLISKNYHVKYATGGLDKDFEGSLIAMDMTQPTTVVMGVSLRKTLDQFYTDLGYALPKVPLHNVLFETGSSELTASAEVNLHSVVSLMKADRKTKIELDGYTDNLGDLFKDKELSQERVKAVKSYLVHHGIRSRRIKTKAFGATHLISTNHSEESRRLNRRVEFVVIRS